MSNTPATRQIDLDKVMEKANQRYAELVGSPLHQIESRQVKALAVAVVNEVNQVLAGMQMQYEAQLAFLASTLKDLDEAVDKVALVGGVNVSHPDRLGVPGE